MRFIDWLGAMMMLGGGLQEQSDLPNLQEENDTLRKEIAHLYLSQAAEVDFLKSRASIAEQIAKLAKADCADCHAKVDAAMVHLLKIKFGEDGHVNN